MYEPLTQYATLIESSHSPEDARTFLIFLKSAAAKKIMIENGYYLDHPTTYVPQLARGT